MKRFLRKWFYRYVTYRVTMKYLSTQETRPADYLSCHLHNINLYAENIVLKSGRKNPTAEIRPEEHASPPL